MITSSVVLLKKANAELPEAFISNLPKELLIETTHDKIDFNRFVKELRSEPVVLSLAKKFPDVFTIKELSHKVITFQICIDENEAEYIDALILKPKFKNQSK